MLVSILITTHFITHQNQTIDFIDKILTALVENPRVGSSILPPATIYIKLTLCGLFLCLLIAISGFLQRSHCVKDSWRR